jgi:hypothetical protein
MIKKEEHKYPLVKVIWIDITADSNWKSLSELDKESLPVCVSVGYLYSVTIDPSRKVLLKSIRVPLSVFQGSRTTNHQLSFSVLINLSGSSWISYSFPPPGSSRYLSFLVWLFAFLKLCHASPSPAGSSCFCQGKNTNARGSRFSVGY